MQVYIVHCIKETFNALCYIGAIFLTSILVPLHELYCSKERQSANFLLTFFYFYSSYFLFYFLFHLFHFMFFIFLFFYGQDASFVMYSHYYVCYLSSIFGPGKGPKALRRCRCFWVVVTVFEKCLRLS